MASCLQEKGWSVSATEGGASGLDLPEGGIPADQADSFIADSTDCLESLGYDQLGNPPPEVARAQFAHYLESKKCLENLGYDISEPSSEAEFVSKYIKQDPNDLTWNPFREVPDTVNIMEVYEECPPDPEEFPSSG